MKLLRNKLRAWLFTDDASHKIPAPALRADVESIETPGMVRILINRAMNGYTVQVLKHKPNPSGPDWTGELLVVKDGAELMDTIKLGLATARLDA